MESTAKQYAPHLRRGFNFCSKNTLQPLNADNTGGTEFLTPYFRKSNCEHTSVNTACSDLSSIHSAFNRFAFGEQPLIKRLFRGMFEERPTFTRYAVTDDVKYALNYVKQCPIFS